jgi:hypothetical protein
MVRNQITPRKIPQPNSPPPKKTTKNKLTTKNQKKRHKGVREQLKKQRNLNIGEHNTNENNHYHDHVS